MRTNEDLLEKLEAWLTEQPAPPTIFDVLATRDVELFAAFILKRFRRAAREAVVERLERESQLMTGVVQDDGAIMRVSDAVAWELALTKAEVAELLGLPDANALDDLRHKPSNAIPIEVLERLTILLDIYQALRALLPAAGRPAQWLRAGNKAPLFGGAAAVQFMLRGGLQGLRNVRAYLQGQVQS
jgi:hypothetical protein